MCFQVGPRAIIVAYQVNNKDLPDNIHDILELVRCVSFVIFDFLMVFLFFQTFRYFIKLKKEQTVDLTLRNVIVIATIYSLWALYIVTSILNSVVFFLI